MFIPGTWMWFHSPLQPSPLCWPASPEGLGQIGTAPAQRYRWKDLEEHSGSRKTQLGGLMLAEKLRGWSAAQCVLF